MCDDVLMRDAASATEEVQQNCARPRTTVTQKLRVTLETGPRRAHRAPAHQPHHASPHPASVAATRTTSARPHRMPGSPPPASVRHLGGVQSLGYGTDSTRSIMKITGQCRGKAALCVALRFSWKSTVESRPSHLGSSARFLSCAFWICLEMAGVCLR